ncbi:MAG: hypothetical protein COV45_02195 [Deltaproteobacteria bacterium CG11_big_fil_rev_8_21_14_0_20_47_16]|nr:MAG: hypothetical protein COV45_02195 [Deltaproteobacteria bacterium CG11_big_fil_rev_8_21_14_0_20_47_16]
MKRLFVLSVLIVCGLCLAAPYAGAKSKKKTQDSSTQPHGGGYYNGEYHIKGKGETGPIFKWDKPINQKAEIKKAYKSPPSKTPSQSTDK